MSTKASKPKTKLSDHPHQERLIDLVSVGPATVKDFELLGIRTIDDLRDQDATELYRRLCVMTKASHDPCVEDVFRAAIEQVNDPNLSQQQKNWWYWSQLRKKRTK
ncbi:MAG: helix-hairpin-helix domain-containing protein [Oligoflexia bacterium]|nr:helix-hairpin-helix domain-containing protein [Oligoflexia bacterium]